MSKMLGRSPVRTECGEDINWKFTKEVPVKKEHEQVDEPTLSRQVGTQTTRNEQADTIS